MRTTPKIFAKLFHKTEDKQCYFLTIFRIHKKNSERTRNLFDGNRKLIFIQKIYYFTDKDKKCCSLSFYRTSEKNWRRSSDWYNSNNGYDQLE